MFATAVQAVQACDDDEDDGVSPGGCGVNCVE